jgi:hypothetical protein
MIKAINFVIWIILFFSALSILVGCDDRGEEESYLIEKTRVLAIKADPPEIGFDDTVPEFPASIMGYPATATDLRATGLPSKVTALAIDPYHRPQSYLWSSGAGLAAETLDTDFSRAAAIPLLPFGTSTVFDLPIDPSVINGAEAALPILTMVVDETSTGPMAFKTLYLSRGRQVNRNPVLEPINIVAGRLVFESSEKIDANIIVTDPDEEDVDVRLNWFIENGELNSWSQEQTVWEPEGAGVQTIYCVARDLRGGADWARQDVYIGDPEKAAPDAVETGASGSYLVESSEGHLFFIGVDSVPSSIIIQEALESGEEISISGIAVPDAERRYNFYLAAESVTASVQIPVSGPNNGRQVDYSDVEAASSLLLLASGLSNFAGEVPESEENENATGDLSTAQDLQYLDKLLNEYFAEILYFRVRVISQVSQ